MIEKLTAAIKIIRPLNFCIIIISVFVASAVASPEKFPVINIILAAISAGLTASAGNIINDIFDIQIDKVNQPNRPLPSGSITIREAYSLFFICIVLSVGLALFVNAIVLLIVLLSHLILFLYSKYLKGIPLVGNLAVAFLTGLVFIFGGVVVENPAASIIPALFAFLINLIREFVKDMEDVEGDSIAGLNTFPVRFGSKNSKTLIFIVTLIIIIFSFFPFVASYYKIEFFLIVMVLVNPIFVYCLKILFEDDSLKNLNRVSNLLKLNMIIGLIAIYMGV
ncbi:MAG: geranylgeranylglycerol-phosphate geranylgeranyltransferase [Ignavibacteriales bacterium]